MTLTQLIKIASEAYDADGAVMKYHLDPDGDHGDGLAKFIAVELAETFDEGATEEEQRNEASHTMSNALDELNCVVDSF